MTPGDDPPGSNPWLDVDAGPVVRPYTVTGGRAHVGSGGLDLLAFIQVETGADASTPHLQPEHRAILRQARRPVPIAELSAQLDLPLGVVRVLLDDLLHSGLISLQEPGVGARRPGVPILEAVINGLRSL